MVISVMKVQQDPQVSLQGKLLINFSASLCLSNANRTKRFVISYASQSRHTPLHIHIYISSRFFKLNLLYRKHPIAICRLHRSRAVFLKINKIHYHLGRSTSTSRLFTFPGASLSSDQPIRRQVREVTQPPKNDQQTSCNHHVSRFNTGGC